MSKASAQQSKSRFGCWSAALLCLVVIVLLGTFLWHGIRGAREAGRWAWCNNYFKQLGLAMHNYHDQYGSFPPAYFADRQGRPTHSWRVLLLPFMAQEERYGHYRFDEPWNSPQNLALADRQPIDESGDKMYLCPSDWDAGKDDTSQVLFVGPGTAFDGPRTTRIQDITDGSSHTAIGGEVSESGIHWMEPRDLNVEEMSFKINDKNRIGLRSNHPHCVNVPFADGSVRTIRDDIDPKLLKSLITINGKEDVSEFFRNQ